MRASMKAVQIHSPSMYSVDEIKIPVPSTQEVLVKIKAVAICGSDPGIFSGKVLHNGWPPVFPFVAGHEFSGEVVALGENVQGLEIGDRVAGEAHCGCGICDMCKRGNYNLCLNYGKQEFAHHHYGHNTPGCYGQYQVYNMRALTKLPDGISYDEGTMVDTAGTAFHALRLTGVRPGGTTVIIGPGPMGMMAMLIAKAMGSQTIVIGRGSRLEMAGKLGATYLLDFESTPDIVSAVKHLTNEMGADQTIEAAGSAGAYLQSVQMTKKGGHVALISIPGQDQQDIAVKTLIMNQITLHGVRANPNCSQPVLDLMQAGILDVKPLLTHRFALENIHEAFDTFLNRKEGALKVLVYPNNEKEGGTECFCMN